MGYPTDGIFVLPPNEQEKYKSIIDIRFDIVFLKGQSMKNNKGSCDLLLAHIKGK